MPFPTVSTEEANTVCSPAALGTARTASKSGDAGDCLHDHRIAYKRTAYGILTNHIYRPPIAGEDSGGFADSALHVVDVPSEHGLLSRL